MHVVPQTLSLHYDQSADNPGDEDSNEPPSHHHHHPIVRGSIVDFDSLERLLDFTFEEELRTHPGEAGMPVRG